MKAAASTATSSCQRAGTSCRRAGTCWASVQTVRGCPKHCSFCSVWRTDGQEPRQRGVGSRRPRDRRAAASRISLHRARRRQLLSGDVRRSCAGATTYRHVPAARARGAARRAIRADGAAGRVAGRSRVLHADHDGGGRGPGVSRCDEAGKDSRRARRRRIGHRGGPEGHLQGLQPGGRRARRAAPRVPAPRRPRPRLVHLRAAERRARHVRRDRRAGRAGRSRRSRSSCC